jgi:hypothetical protein
MVGRHGCFTALQEGNGDTMRNRFHSLCPYFAMFPEAFALKWIQKLTRPGDTILDPFSGRGTTALTALLAGRNAVATDVNEVAFCLTKAKTNTPSLSHLLSRIAKLRKGFELEVWSHQAHSTSEFFHACYHPHTLAQLLYLRSTLNWRENKTDAMIAGLALGSLHGDARPHSPYFSNQMPRTISTKPGYSVRFWHNRSLIAPERDVFEILHGRASFRYLSERPSGKAVVLNSDMRNLPLHREKWADIKCVITSPPYLNVTSFEEDQWLRLWFLGGPGFPARNKQSKDDRHTRPETYWSFIGDMWRSLGGVVGDGGHVIIRIGSRSIEAQAMKEMLTACTQVSNRKVRLVSSCVTELQKRQTDAFRPGTSGCKVELDCHFEYA